MGRSRTPLWPQGYRGFGPHTQAAPRMLGRIPKTHNMNYVYILKSHPDNKLYIGRTTNLKRRYSEHNAGKVSSTKSRRPLILLCYEAYNSSVIAAEREKYLKSSDGHKDLYKRGVMEA